MEGRDSKKIYIDLLSIDSLDDGELKALSLKSWADEFLTNNIELELNEKELKQFMELFYRNIKFLKQYTTSLSKKIKENKEIRKFYK
jgi:hypothetical protein